MKIAQFGGINTITDSSNLGVSEVREAKNFILRPLGGLSVPPAWTSFAPGGTALDLGYTNLIQYLFDGGRLLLQDSTAVWWNVSLDAVGIPANVTVAYAGATISTNLSVASNQILGFKITAGNYQRLGADQFAATWFTEPLGTVPYYQYRYTTDQAFAYGYGPIFTDGAANQWKLYAQVGVGLNAQLL